MPKKIKSGNTLRKDGSVKKKVSITNNGKTKSVTRYKKKPTKKGTTSVTRIKTNGAKSQKLIYTNLKKK